MRDGNPGGGSGNHRPGPVVSLPMRDGNPFGDEMSDFQSKLLAYL